MPTSLLTPAVLSLLIAAQTSPTPQPVTPTPTPSTAPTPAPAPTPAAAPPALSPTAPEPGQGAYADAKALLVALEKADEGLDRLQALVRYDVTEVEVEGRSVRQGELFFDRAKAEGAKPAIRRFAVRFDTLRVDATTRKEERFHVFDGRWYAEKSPAQKKINRKEVVPPGEAFDPLKIGEGPLPIPIGQKHEDILARYDAELKTVDDGLDAKDEALRAFVAGCVQVRLTPKESFRERDRFTEIRLWYRGKRPEDMGPKDPPSDRLLPRLARTVAHNGNITLVQLINVRVNGDPIDPSILDTSAPDGWDVIETPFRGAPPARPAPAAPAKPESDPAKPAPAEEKKDDGNPPAPK